MLENQENVKSRSDKGYHVVPPPYTGNYIPPKPNLMFIDEQVKSESVDVFSNFASSDVKTIESKHESVDVKNKGVYRIVETKHVKKNIFSPPIIEDWNFDDDSEVEFEPKVKVKIVRPSIKKIKFVKTTKEKVKKETNAILLIMKIMRVDLFPLEMVKVEFLEKLLDESQVLQIIQRKDNVYSVDLKSVVPTGGLTYLFAKAIVDESNLWHRRLGYINCKSMNKLVRKRVVRVNTACYVLNGALVIKPHNKTPYELIHRRPLLIDFMKPFGCPVTILNTLIEAARTMLVDSKLPTTFWAEAVNTACYVLNRALVIKPHNKTPYELIHGRPPLIDFMKPFGCPVTILNTRDSLGKFDRKDDEGFFVGYLVVSKAMIVFNKRTRIVEETLNIIFLENAPNVKGNGPYWLFDIDSLTISMNYELVVAGKQTNGSEGTKDNIV
nr:ribonuclease H-like domain-containing protein [Tanacetum cinerariifolium]